MAVGMCGRTSPTDGRGDPTDQCHVESLVVDGRLVRRQSLPRRIAGGAAPSSSSPVDHADCHLHERHNMRSPACAGMAGVAAPSPSASDRQSAVADGSWMAWTAAGMAGIWVAGCCSSARISPMSSTIRGDPNAMHAHVPGFPSLPAANPGTTSGSSWPLAMVLTRSAEVRRRAVRSRPAGEAHVHPSIPGGRRPPTAPIAPSSSSRRVRH